jgi:hypothetical protein
LESSALLSSLMVRPTFGFLSWMNVLMSVLWNLLAAATSNPDDPLIPRYIGRQMEHQSHRCKTCQVPGRIRDHGLHRSFPTRHGSNGHYFVDPLTEEHHNLVSKVSKLHSNLITMAAPQTWPHQLLKDSTCDALWCPHHIHHLKLSWTDGNSC